AGVVAGVNRPVSAGDGRSREPDGGRNERHERENERWLRTPRLGLLVTHIAMVDSGAIGRLSNDYRDRRLCGRPQPVPRSQLAAAARWDPRFVFEGEGT